MSVIYKGAAPTEDGTYLVRVEGKRLEIAELDTFGNAGDLTFHTWQQIGNDFDMWDNGGDFEIDIIRKLDLDELASGAVTPTVAQQPEPVDEAEIVERMVNTLARPFPEVNLSISRGIDGWRELMRDAYRAAFHAAPQKPVAWRWRYKDSGPNDWVECAWYEPNQNQLNAFIVEPLYAGPQAPARIEYTTAMGEAAQAYFNSFEHFRIHTPGTFRFEILWNVMQAAAGLSDPTQYKVGPLTMQYVFTPAGLTNLSDLQAVLDQAETAFSGLVSDMESWQLVPKEPTQKMLDAFAQGHGRKCLDISSMHPTEHPDDGGGPVGYGYRAMLAAAPEKP